MSDDVRQSGRTTRHLRAFMREMRVEKEHGYFVVPSFAFIDYVMRIALKESDADRAAYDVVWIGDQKLTFVPMRVAYQKLRGTRRLIAYDHACVSVDLIGFG